MTRQQQDVIRWLNKQSFKVGSFDEQFVTGLGYKLEKKPGTILSDKQNIYLFKLSQRLGYKRKKEGRDTMKLMFGKYEGKDIRNVPKDYLEYLLTWKDLHEQTRNAIQQQVDKYNGQRSTILPAEPKRDTVAEATILVLEGKV